MSDQDYVYHKKLVEGLVGDRKAMYHNNVHFNRAVNALAEMLPLWVDGIANKSSDRADKIESLRLELAEVKRRLRRL